MSEQETSTELEVALDPAPSKPRRYRLHGGRCCSATPPVLSWNEKLEAVVCLSCGRVWAPIIMTLDDVIQTTIIRAFAIVHGCHTKTGRMLEQNRHAIRRKLAKYQIKLTPDLVVSYAAPGPDVEELSP